MLTTWGRSVLAADEGVADLLADGDAATGELRLRARRLDAEVTTDLGRPGAT